MWGPNWVRCHQQFIFLYLPTILRIVEVFSYILNSDPIFQGFCYDPHLSSSLQLLKFVAGYRIMHTFLPYDEILPALYSVLAFLSQKQWWCQYSLKPFPFQLDSSCLGLITVPLSHFFNKKDPISFALIKFMVFSLKV